VINFAPPSASVDRRLSADVAFSDVEAFCLRWIFRQAGLNVHDYRPESVQRRVSGLLRALRVRSLPEARSLLRTSPALLPTAMDALLIGVTSFFRDPDMFNALRGTALPELLCRGGEVRIWGTACSDGLELYSLAMLLAELELLHRARLLGTDCRASAVSNARRGAFAPAELRDVDPALLRRHLHLREGAWCVSPVIRSRMRWRQADVLREMEPGEWDLILCRNFAIYLRAGATIELWTRVRGALRRGGFLVTGKAERLGMICGFRQVGPCLYRREE